ncbi:YtxH domain-containing protein [Clostridium sp.]|uniref:YtxH domain-containing protein n=1 Tax=Clostridium sp. TaxID=1506 RepID=UPI002610C91A|nr:YtxH domain-containing protein [Clostridium sp.]
MGNKLISTLAAGMIGAAVGVMITPNLDRRTQKAIKKASKRMMNAANCQMEWMK